MSSGAPVPAISRTALLESLQAHYFETFPDGRERLTWPGITYVRVRPRWIRYSNYRVTPPLIVELTGAELAELR
jgi:hypothetical protein